MRKKYITPEYNYIPVHGTLQMVEQSNFFCSNLISLEDVVEVYSDDLIYFQNNKKEQVNENTEIGLQPTNYIIFDNKLNNHTFTRDLYSNDLQTTWNIEVNILNIFINHLFALFKHYRTFNGVLNNMTYQNSVDIAIREYISYNIYDKYRLSEFKLYVLYNNIRDNDGLIYQNEFSKDALNGEIIDNMQSTISDNILNMNFNQNNNINNFNFKYYFDLKFTKI